MNNICALSFPLRERGLKLSENGRNQRTLLSFPLRERGLKQHVRKSLE